MGFRIMCIMPETPHVFHDVWTKRVLAGGARTVGVLGGEGTRAALETNAAVAAKIRDYLSENFLFSDDGFSYEDDASFLELGIIDSFGFVELLAWVHEAFGITVADEELVPDNFDSVQKLTSFIGRKRGGT